MGSCTPSHVVQAIAIVMVLLLFGSMAQAQGENYQLSSNESSAMHQLFETWKETPELQNNLPGWSNSTLPCDRSYPWEGVRCLWKEWSNDSSGGDKYIVGLRLISSSLVGTIPPAFGMLQSLITIAIQENPNLKGTLPKELGNLPSINSLKIIGNSLSGPIPNNVVSSTFLQAMDFSRNNFNGEIPENLFSAAPGLSKVNMSRNNFEGVFPWNVFSNKTMLTQVDFSHNNFTGPLPIFNPYFIYIDFSYNHFEGKLFNSIKMQSLDFINLSNNQLSGEISPLEFFNTSTQITTLDLSYNNFTGLLPNLDLLTSLETLDLSYNNFDYGPFPNWITNLSTLKSLSLNGNGMTGLLDVLKLGTSLQVLNLEFNNIKGVLYNGLMKDLKATIRLRGNPYCNNSSTSDLKKCVCEQYCVDTGEDAKGVIKTTIISVVTCSSVLAIIILIVALLLWKTKKEQKYVLLAVQQRFLQYDVKPTLFTFHELRVATKDFHSSMKLGEGNFGIVYKGVLPNGNFVAVKQLFNIDAQKDIDDFLNEVVLLTSVKHRNLVNLKGCCLHKNQRWLLFDYVENFDIDQVLFEHKGGIVLNWSQRLNICIGIAQGLHYLHALSQPRIIHRDIKASNVLLDKTFNAKIADFGLALLFPNEQSHVTTFQVAGSRGYLAPEYATMGQLSEKVDVYSFGALMLEIISGRRNIDYNLPQNKVYLSKWAWKLYTEDKLMDLVDSTLLLSNREEMEIKQAINIALLCSQIQADSRPTMAQVVAMLQGHTSIESELTSYLANREIEEESYYSHMVMEGANLNLISIPEDSSVRVFSGPLSSTIDSYSSMDNSFHLENIKEK